MVISLAVIVLAAGVIYQFIPHDEGKDPVKPVSYDIEVKSARRAAPYPVAAPEGLSKKWRATSVRYTAGQGPEGSRWHLGFMTPDDEYAAVEQSDAKRPERYVRDITQGAEKTARTERIGGTEWVRYEGAKYDALVRKPDADSKASTVVTGTAPFKQLRQLAGALEARKVQVPSTPPSTPSDKAASGQAAG
nr:DUF4245 domain-containing protein [Streptomyces boncukensis]